MHFECLIFAYCYVHKNISETMVAASRSKFHKLRYQLQDQKIHKLRYVSRQKFHKLRYQPQVQKFHKPRYQPQHTEARTYLARLLKFTPSKGFEGRFLILCIVYLQSPFCAVSHKSVITTTLKTTCVKSTYSSLGCQHTLKRTIESCEQASRFFCIGISLFLSLSLFLSINHHTRTTMRWGYSFECGVTSGIKEFSCKLWSTKLLLENVVPRVYTIRIFSGELGG